MTISFKSALDLKYHVQIYKTDRRKIELHQSQILINSH